MASILNTCGSFGRTSNRLQQATGDAESIRLRATGEAEAIRAKGKAQASAYCAGAEAIGAEGYTAVQLMQIIGEKAVRIIPEVKPAKF